MKRSGWQQWLPWLFFFSLVVYFIFLIRQDIIDNLELKKERANVSKKLKQEEEHRVKLKDRLGRGKSDDLIEELARTRLGFIKKGEVPYKVVY
jgi:cell division protein FtsB